MIQAFIFDLDGTLVQTEALKARSYARAAAALRPGAVSEEEVLDRFKEVVGLSRQRVAAALLGWFALETQAGARMAELGVESPREAFLAIRLEIYDAMLRDPAVLRAHLCPFNTALLERVRGQSYKTGLATMSYREQASRVLDILKLTPLSDHTATREDVRHGKPDPEIYLHVASAIATYVSDCLVIEDSPSGVRAALAANMPCIAVTNDYTREAIHAADVLEPRWIVDDLATLEAIADEAVALHAAV